MAYIISGECIACGGCVTECPVEAISKGDDRYVINTDECEIAVCVRKPVLLARLYLS